VHEVQVVAKQFAFEPAVIQVTEGEPIRLAMRSADRAHGFAIRDLTIDVQSRAAETSSSNSPPHVPGGTKSPAPNSAGAGMGR
jgi:heme/copper-type cytochrome/quinol oxidase subunit 2